MENKIDLDIYNNWSERIIKEAKNVGIEEIVFHIDNNNKLNSFQNYESSYNFYNLSKKNNWKLTQYIDIEKNDVNFINKQILTLINNSSINTFYIKTNKFIDLKAIFKNIKTNNIELIIIFNKSELSAKIYLKEFEAVFKRIVVVEESSNFDKLKENKVNAITNRCLYINTSKLNSNEIINQLSEMLFQINNYLSKYKDDKNNSIDIFIENNCKDNFFQNIAKLRAIRILIESLSNSYNLLIKLNIISNTSIIYKANREENFDNLFKLSNQSLSSILGMCDYLVISDYQGIDDDNDSVISNNISDLIKYESKIDQNIDLVFGSYFIEKLTDEICKLTYLNFQRR